MSQPIFSLAYTSVRASQIRPVIDTWRNIASGQHKIEVVICVDGNSPKCIEAAHAVPDAKVVVQPEAPFNSTRGWNKAAEATTGKVIICVADDFRPCQFWDEKLFTLKDGWTNEDWVVHTEDGYVHTLCVLSILTRKRYERFGYVFYPKYPSLFSDTEFTHVAYNEGRVIQAKHIFMEHMHPDCRKRLRDSFDMHHASREREVQGELLFNFRRSQGFPIDDGPKALASVQIAPPREEPKKPNDYSSFAMYMQANRDDFCLEEVAERMFEEGIRNFFFCIPDEYWSGKPTSQEEINQVQHIASRLKQRDLNAQSKVFCVANYRFPGDNRIAVETRVRNDALAWVRQNGFNNICIVDSDELWKKGTLAIIKELVDSSRPLAISLPMVPVMGFPGYPIQGASDRVISYIGQGCLLRDCRAPMGQVTHENRTTVYHFTSIRKTREDTIQKHRDSGHYDDPQYDFENWIKNVLPNTRPGMKNAHMYKPAQIWPEVRAWTENDLKEIPQSLHQYLGTEH